MITTTIADASERRSVWTTWNLGSAAARATKLLRMASPTERERLIGEVATAAADRCVHLDDTRDPATRRVGESLYTSVELLAAEKTLIDAAETVVDLRHLHGNPRYRLMRRTATLAGLADDQRAAVEAICGSPRALDVMVGPAGSGKTTTLAALATIWGANCGQVVGLAPSASAAHTLEQALGVPCHTTAKWLHETVGPGARARATTYATAKETDHAMLLSGHVDRHALQAVRGTWWKAQQDQEPWRLNPGHLVVVDEASLADTRSLAELVAQAHVAGTKILLVGDHFQRGSVAAGGAFGLLARRGPTAELMSLWRFAHPWEARASLELRRGHAVALDAYSEHGAISSGDRETMLDAAIDAFTRAHSAGQVALLQAADVRTVRELNARAHTDAVLTGRAAPGDGIVLHDGLSATVGERVVTRRNARRLRGPDGYVRNGSLWDVVATRPDGSLRVHPANPTGRDGSRHRRASAGDEAVGLPANYVAKHVELGYATTTARSQGLTVDESHTIAAPGMAREDLYVAMSRGRQNNHVYVATDRADDDCLPGRRGAVAVTGRQVLDRILATTNAEPTATETWDTYHPGRPTPIPSIAETHALDAESQHALAAPVHARHASAAHVIERSGP